VRAVRTSRRTAASSLPLGPADLALGASLCGVALWALLVGWQGDRGLSATLAYVVAPLALLAGAAMSRWAASRGAGVVVAAAAAALLLAAVVVVPFYSNAEAAAGVQLVALAAMARMGTVPAVPGSRGDTAMVLLAALIAVLGILLAARSQAASLLAVLIVVIAVLALHGRFSLPRPALRGIGLVSIAGAVLVVLFLAAAPFWPWWLEQNESLSWARQSLWRDALAHSALLQVAAELGGVGALLLLAALISGVLVAAQGDRSQRVIGVTAWCALSVHSMIDHLYEFPLVCLLAGAVIGWAGAPARRDSPAVPRQRART
jgi:hypothetical protein